MPYIGNRPFIGNVTVLTDSVETADIKDGAVTAAKLSGISTINITEGTNLYYTDARARAAISVTDAGGDGSLTYDSATGIITYTGPSATEARSYFSASGDITYNSTTGVFNVTLATTTATARTSISVTDSGNDGAMTYNNTTGVITYTGPTDSEIRAHYTAGTGITITTGQIAATSKDIAWSTIQTASFSALAGFGYPVNTTNGVIIAALPTSPNTGDTIVLEDYASTFATNNLYIWAGGTLKINGSTNSLVLNTNGTSIQLVYADVTQGWLAYGDGSTSIYSTGTSTIAQYLVLAGGGGGGGQQNAGIAGNVHVRGAGGGGAGGYRTGIMYGPSSISPGVVRRGGIIVGAGGNGAPNGTNENANGTNGNCSVLGGIISAGGGKGAPVSGGNPGGSGGGMGSTCAFGGTAGCGNVPPTTPVQGYPGGPSNNCGGPAPASGGGGGAGGPGLPAHPGGPGAVSCILGVNCTFGIGGNGGWGWPGGSPGGANRGGGGCGGEYYGSGGGSGVIIIRVPTGYGVGFSSGVTCTLSFVGSDTVAQVTATSTVNENYCIYYPAQLVEYLVVAGGGGGGSSTCGQTNGGGGGGAGGFRTGSIYVTTGCALPLCVGNGGTGAVNSSGTSGNPSIFATVVSAGGGGGGITGPGSVGLSGGSGGGAGAGTSGTGGCGNIPVTSPSQGNNGSVNGGGGGAGAAATTCCGGAGTASSITGTSVTYAGGGSRGSGFSPSATYAGGTGGGGQGGAYPGGVGVAGTTNLGGGGGGGAGFAGGNGAAAGGPGGRGIVILKVSNNNSVTFSAGVTQTLSTSVPGVKIYSVTATSTANETVTIT